MVDASRSEIGYLKWSAFPLAFGAASAAGSCRKCGDTAGDVATPWRKNNAVNGSVYLTETTDAHVFTNSDSHHRYPETLSDTRVCDAYVLSLTKTLALNIHLYCA